MNQNNPTLVIMAAGMGSRFGGLKQIEPVDPEGHIIIDFSLFDAWRAGFRDVVFIIKREMEAEFRERIGNRMEQYFHVSYVFQEIDRLPDGIAVPDGRTKPWGTGHALACCKGVVNGRSPSSMRMISMAARRSRKSMISLRHRPMRASMRWSAIA